MTPRFRPKMAQKAILVDESYGTSYIALADAYMMIRKHDDAIAAINKAVRIQPGDAFPHLWLGWYLHWAGRGEEAIDAIKKARQLDPMYQYARHQAYLISWVRPVLQRAFMRSLSQIGQFGAIISNCIS